MTRLLSVALTLVVAVLAGCIWPPTVCGCSPPPMPGTMTAIVFDDVGARVPATAVLVVRGTVESCAPTIPEEQRTEQTRADGSVELREDALMGWACLRLQALPRAGSSLRPSDVVFARFNAGVTLANPIVLRLQAAP